MISFCQTPEDIVEDGSFDKDIVHPKRSFMEVVQATKVTGHHQIDHDLPSYWDRNKNEMPHLNLSSLLGSHKTNKTSEDFLQESISIDLFSEDKALVKFNKEILGKWYEYGRMHLKVERWSKKDTSL
uniref:Uncharacterized protein n=1 Tax=Cucumis melo TaxID=3656 RepID=A0A9I9DWL2_CUCME